MRDAMTEAGPPLDCRPHGLRKASYRLLADVGATAHEIMAVARPSDDCGGRRKFAKFKGNQNEGKTAGAPKGNRTPVSAL